MKDELQIIKEIKSMTDSWIVISDYLIDPETKEEYDRLVELADYLVDTVGNNENHKLYRFMNMVFLLISHYEELNIPEPI